MDAEIVVALEQIHLAPTDDIIEHVISPFCPCEPKLEMEHMDDDGDPVEVISYRHRQVDPNGDLNREGDGC